MKTIRTKSNKKQVEAFLDRASISLQWDATRSHGSNHARAAIALCQKLKINHKELIGDRLDDHQWFFILGGFKAIDLANE